MPRKLSESLTFKHGLMGLVFLISLLSGFALWVIGQAQAAVEDHIASPNPHPGIEERFNRIESKIDSIYDLLLNERH